jgi:hypothetical protein
MKVQAASKREMCAAITERYCQNQERGSLLREEKTPQQQHELFSTTAKHHLIL